MDATGYAARVASSSDTSVLTPYIIQSILLLVAPALIAAIIYMLFGRMLVLLRCTSLSIVPSRFNTTFFVVGDVFSFFLQAAGGGVNVARGFNQHRIEHCRGRSFRTDSILWSLFHH